MERPRRHSENGDDSKFCSRCAVPLAHAEAASAALTELPAWLEKRLKPLKRYPIALDGSLTV